MEHVNVGEWGRGPSTGTKYDELLRLPTLSTGVYVIPAGGTDPQKPQTEDEFYYVVRGRSMMHVGGKDFAVTTGSLILVPAGVAHRFHMIEEELVILVFFAPAEGSTSGAK